MKPKYSPIGIDFSLPTVRFAQCAFDDEGALNAEGLRADGEVTLHAVGELKLEDPLQPSETTHAKDALKQFIRSSAFHGKDALIRLPDHLIDYKLIAQSLNGATQQDLEALVVEEARNFLAYDLSDAVLDYLSITPPQGSDQAAARLLLVAIKREIVHGYLQYLKRAGLNCLAVDIGLCANQRVLPYLAGLDDGDDVVAVLDLGSRATTITLYQGRELLLMRSVAFGEQTILESLMKELEITQRQATNLMTRYGLIGSIKNTVAVQGESELVEDVAHTVYDILRAALARLLSEIDKIFMFQSSIARGRSIKQTVLCGASNCVQHLDEFLSDQLQVDTTSAVMNQRFLGGAPQALQLEKAMMPNYITAVGLALRREANSP